MIWQVPRNPHQIYGRGIKSGKDDTHSPASTGWKSLWLVCQTLLKRIKTITDRVSDRKYREAVCYQHAVVSPALSWHTSHLPVHSHLLFMIPLTDVSRKGSTRNPSI